MIDFRSHTLGNDDAVLVIELSGKLDTEACDYFFSCLEEEITDGITNIIVDCRGLEFVSSMGLGMFLRAHSRMKKKGGVVKLAHIGSSIADVLRTVHLDRILQVYPNVDAAFSSFRPEA